jgi:hypothetical protein
MLVGHHYTQHPAFLFVLGTFSFLLLAILAVVIYFLVSDSAALTDKNVVESLREFARVPIWKTGISLVYQTACCLYLLYVQAFVVFSLFFAISVMAYASRKLCKEIVAKQK